jgi:surfeit locus 1 family protein
MPGLEPRRRRSLFGLATLTILAAALMLGFVALGIWQVERLAWKRALIVRVDARLSAAPVAARRAADPDDAYRRVTLHGVFLHAQAVFVRATTERGAGYWVMTPLLGDRGFTVLVNRGFVPPAIRASGQFAKPSGPVTITGLLRITEPKGGFLRANDPATDRWYSRDVAAIAAASHLRGPVAPYFIDAGAGSDPVALPVGGLTIVRFPNNHLAYAATWFALAAMVVAAYIALMRWEWISRRNADNR